MLFVEAEDCEMRNAKPDWKAEAEVEVEVEVEACVFCRQDRPRRDAVPCITSQRENGLLHYFHHIGASVLVLAIGIDAN